MSEDSPDYQNQLSRVRRIAGQVRGIERMIGEQEECTAILTQVIAARGALKSLAEVLISEHVSHCVEGASSAEDSERHLKELLTVLKRYVS
ncbi:MAG: metal-sensitive transcriptional regulator [Verrucomicrobiota bacterium]